MRDYVRDGVMCVRVMSIGTINPSVSPLGLQHPTLIDRD